MPGHGVVLKQLGKDAHECLAGGHVRAAAVLKQQPGVAGFLARQDLGDEHWRVGGQRLLHRGSPGFADEHVLAPEQGGELLHPAQNLHGLSHASGHGGERLSQERVPAHTHRELEVQLPQQPFHQRQRALGAAGEQEQEPWSDPIAGGGTLGRVQREAGRDRKAGDHHLFGGDPRGPQHDGRVFVGNQKRVRLAAVPDGVDRNGVGNQYKAFASRQAGLPRRRFEQVPVHRVDGDHGRRADPLERNGQFVGERPQQPVRVAQQEREAVEQRV